MRAIISAGTQAFKWAGQMAPRGARHDYPVPGTVDRRCGGLYDG